MAFGVNAEAVIHNFCHRPKNSKMNICYAQYLLEFINKIHF